MNNKFFNRFFVGVSFGTVLLMVVGWADAAERQGKTTKCTFSEVEGTVIISCPKPTLVCHFEVLQQGGRKGEKVLVCEGGLPESK